MLYMLSDDSHSVTHGGIICKKIYVANKLGYRVQIDKTVQFG